MRDTHTRTVAETELRPFRTMIRRAGGIITRSAPIGAGYVITWTYRDNEK